MTNQEIKNTGLLIKNEQQIGGNTALRVGGVIEGIGYALDNKDAANGYYQATINGGSISVNAPNYVLGTSGNIRIKMLAAGTTASTLTIGNANAVQLLYNGAAVDATNGWEANEIISVFYDGTRFMASNSQGGGGKFGTGEKVKDTNITNHVTQNDSSLVTSGGVYNGVPTFENTNDADLDIADNNGNVLARFQDGHFQVKNFDSRDVALKIENDVNADLDITDENNNILARFKDGHIEVKNFNSANLVSIVSEIYPYIIKNNHPLHGKKVGFLGDSITEGAGLGNNRYSTKLCNLIGCEEVNMGVGGTCIANNTLNGRSSERFLTRVTQQNIADLDFLFIFGGTNDFSYDSKPIGEHFSINQISAGSSYIGSTQLGTIQDNETFSGALHELILAVRAIKYNLPMCFITPLNRGRYTKNVAEARPCTADVNTQGNYLYEFEDAIVDIAKFYAIPSIRMGSLLNNNPNSNGDSNLFQTGGDNLHPNAAGADRIANLLFKWTLNNVSI